LGKKIGKEEKTGRGRKRGDWKWRGSCNPPPPDSANFGKKGEEEYTTKKNFSKQTEGENHRRGIKF